MKSSSFTYKAILVSFLYWVADSMIHKLIYLEEEFEFIPAEINELWMRVVIVILLVCFGIYADKHTKTMLEKEKEKHIIFRATIYSTEHILNNLMNQMVYFKMIADKKNVFDSEDNELYENAIKKGKELVARLSSVEKLTEEDIKDSVSPKNEN